MDMREYGAALAMNITYVSNMIIADAVILRRKDTEFKDMVISYERSIFYDIGGFLKIGIPGMLMLCFEWWALEILAIFAGKLSVNDLAAQILSI